MAEPAAKKQKTEEEEAAPEDAEMKADEPAKAEPPKEHEEDAKACSKPKIKDSAQFLTADTTLNVMPSVKNNVLMCMSEGAISHLSAGARCNVGLKSGRYMFEAKVLEYTTTPESGHRSRPTIRVGFSTGSAPLVLGCSEHDFCFDGEGFFLHNSKRDAGHGKFSQRNPIIGVVLNLEKGHENFNTVSLFLNGKRSSKPVPLPEKLQGQTLYPHVTFKGVNVHVNFGAQSMTQMPFSCRMVQDAAQADCGQTRQASAPADGKHSVMFPVSLPDEGTFDWLDMFLEKNPNFLELSDRMISSWAEMSGLPKQPKGKGSNDKPPLAQELRDGSLHRSIMNVAPLSGRDYVIMEVRNNLLQEEREKVLASFPADKFKKVAHVTVGEPPKDFLARVQKLTLQQKQAAADAKFKQERLEEQRKKMMAKKQKELEKAKKKAEKERAKKLAEAKKRMEEAKKAREAKAKEAKGEKKEGEEEKKEEEKVEEEKKEEEPEVEEESAAEEEEPEGPEPTPPKVALDAEDKKRKFRDTPIKDLDQSTVARSFSKFTLPEQAEGFDEVKYEWSPAAKCKTIVKDWIMERKLTTRVEDIKPSEVFDKRHKDWKSAVGKWHAKQSEYRNKRQKRAAAKAAKEAKAKAKLIADAKAQEKKEAEEKARAEKGEEKKEEEEKEEKEEEKKEEPEAPEEPDPEEVVDFPKVDIFGLDDVCSIEDSGMPAFKEFASEDWAMMSLRFELYLLVCSFKRDANDEDREGIFLEHLPFYYNKYFKKTLSPKDYGVETLQELVGLVKDTVHVSARSVLQTQVNEDLERDQVFVMLTEAARRHRSLQIDLGNEMAKLKLSGGALGGHGWQGYGNGKAAAGYQQRQHGGYQQVGKVQAPKGAGKGFTRFTPYGGAKGSPKGSPKGAGKRK